MLLRNKSLLEALIHTELDISCIGKALGNNCSVSKVIPVFPELC